MSIQSVGGIRANELHYWPMKRVLLTNFHPAGSVGEKGGHTTYVRTLLESELIRQFEFAVAAPEGSAIWQTGRAHNAPTFSCDFPGTLRELPAIFRALRRFESIYREWPPDLIHLNGARDQQIAVCFKKFYGHSVPCLRTHHAVRCIPDNVYNRWSYHKMVQRHIYVGHRAKDISWTGRCLRPRNSQVIPNGVDLDFWKPMPRDAAFMKKYGIGEKDFVFGSHAGMELHKRTDLFLRGAALARDRGAPSFKILLRGNDDQIGPSQTLAGELGLKNVIYAGRELDPRGYLSLIDVGFILSDSIEAISFAARELMAMGKPLLSSSYAGLVENVDDRWNGRLIECGDADTVAEAIRWFLDLPPASLQQMGGRAREKAEAVFDVRNQIHAMAQLYTSLIE
jgi:glycosyltransferase involved in cell wall biosynthesis